jgi:hypothetical protein
MFVVCSINLEEQCLAWGIFLKIEMLKLRPPIIRYIIGWMNFSSGFHCCFLPWFEILFFFHAWVLGGGLKTWSRVFDLVFQRVLIKLYKPLTKMFIVYMAAKMRPSWKYFSKFCIRWYLLQRDSPNLRVVSIARGHKPKYYGSSRQKVMS